MQQFIPERSIIKSSSKRIVQNQKLIYSVVPSGLFCFTIMGKVYNLPNPKQQYIVMFCLLGISFTFVLAVAAISRKSLNENGVADENHRDENSHIGKSNDGLIGGFTVPAWFKQITGTDSIPLTSTQPMHAGHDVGKIRESSQTEFGRKQSDYVTPSRFFKMFWTSLITSEGVKILAIIVVIIALDYCFAGALKLLINYFQKRYIKPEEKPSETIDWSTLHKQFCEVADSHKSHIKI